MLAKLGVGESDARAASISHARVADEASLPARVRVEVSDEELLEERTEERQEQPARAMARVA